MKRLDPKIIKWANDWLKYLEEHPNVRLEHIPHKPCKCVRSEPERDAA